VPHSCCSTTSTCVPNPKCCCCTPPNELNGMADCDPSLRPPVSRHDTKRLFVLLRPGPAAVRQQMSANAYNNRWLVVCVLEIMLHVDHYCFPTNFFCGRGRLHHDLSIGDPRYAKNSHIPLRQVLQVPYPLFINPQRLNIRSPFPMLCRYRYATYDRSTRLPPCLQEVRRFVGMVPILLRHCRYVGVYAQLRPTRLGHCCHKFEQRGFYSLPAPRSATSCTIPPSPAINSALASSCLIPSIGLYPIRTHTPTPHPPSHGSASPARPAALKASKQLDRSTLRELPSVPPFRAVTLPLTLPQAKH